MKKRYACCTTRAAHWSVALLLLALVSALLTACSPGHTGGDEIVFLRDGSVWTISPDGSNLQQIESGGFIGAAWSPDHHQIVLRMQDGARAQAGSFFGQGDSASELGVTAIDGGNILQITPPNSGLWRSDAWWDGSGNRLLYREEPASGSAAHGRSSEERASGITGTPQWKLSQADQPAGIARKDLPASVTLPAVNSDGTLIASIDASGRVLLGPPGVAPRVLASGALTILPGSVPYPARPLWQPGGGHLLYAVAGTTPDATTLLLSDTSGHSQPLLTVSQLQQYVWSPDGQHLLLRTAEALLIYSASGVEQFAWTHPGGLVLPFWSPDSRFVLVFTPEGISLINVAARQMLQVLSGTVALPPAPTSAEQAPFLRPAVNSPWKSDSSAFLFTNDGQGIWAAQPGKALPSGSGTGDGLYSSELDNSAQAGHNSAARFPTLLDWGEHQSVSWSTLDPNCAFLIL